MPPFETTKGEPFGAEHAAKVRGREVLNQLNEFVDSPLEFRASLASRFTYKNEVK